MTIFVVLSVVLFCVLLIVLSRPRRRDGLAPEGGSRLKNAVAFAMVKFGARRREIWESAEYADKRVPVPQGVDEANYNDSFVFQGSDAKGNVVLTRLGFRGGGDEVEIWFWGVIDGNKFANNEQKVVLSSQKDSGGIAAAGLKYEKISEGLWSIVYDGELNGKQSSVRLTWKADAAMYCSADHMDYRGTALAMAEMPWSREYFDRIRSEKQVRIEQGGSLNGSLNVGEKRYELNMRGVRDHSWGKRDWTYLNRYLWTVMALDEEIDMAGVTVRYLAVSPVDYGGSFKRLSSGWIAGADKVLPVSFCSDPVQIGGDGVIPDEFTLSFRVPGSELFTLVLKRRQPEMSWLVQNNSFEINEAWCSVNLESKSPKDKTLNGQNGFGLSEFGYAANKGYFRPFEEKNRT